MINVITELSKYVILTLMIVYTFHCFYMVWRQDEEEKKEDSKAEKASDKKVPAKRGRKPKQR